MNKRIRELAEQAMESTGVEGLGGEYRELNPEKFAELIVRECAKVAFDDWCEGTNESSSEQAILKHFGVAE